ncbi:hypothetical protein CO057_01595 [Candidatus Uhrbacteria bacterium CG_4_9_14_0_2_um_filter_41_50]|uniref:Uncharacterized protein n=1 Tax=Candidatus Uhrbacteria bacterium CG_4_9_14_0_2_um_filter_41_50 TaxID=1975031 RepID=A0A2M8EPL0_9BACT|nr:MAG: hypothetical protein COZ45_00105 [Candidatus Uhrbacteria bacterium CG_4_10_14_3_um_filter_41_21]PIZ54847.1 MAG: hypothetical protein COY24_02435 [Candidatus Uhrbacteria bacterium CG_4_10_14_0_2_um_filter_41_21]PJB84337.1 MAG: hypothetical protein CO086_04185 [Candidatus Uhrbacteria bacterium CG_4_9_14_0_8_um_filter_41_16]PJC24683.1 MAG: hypothetical protein CO057_01595 [Candidatus Uhrbacteria bacterium CG_4_9_14_0_2_um_filter_41_50]PJE75072.1 MAG: hypothetical protein COV03_02120 [Candi
MPKEKSVAILPPWDERDIQLNSPDFNGAFARGRPRLDANRLDAFKEEDPERMKALRRWAAERKKEKESPGTDEE